MPADGVGEHSNAYPSVESVTGFGWVRSGGDDVARSTRWRSCASNNPEP